MNERLKELMIESGAYDYYEINEGVEDDEKPMVKLAELIVRKCAHVGFNAAYPGKGVDVSIAIKQHFGVDEE